MLKIKLARFGKKGQPHYRIVVNEARDKRDGSYVAKVGHYIPTQSPKVLEIDADAYKEWVGKGAQPTPTVAGLFERYQSGNPFPAGKTKLSKKAKAKQEQAKEEAETASEPEVAQEAAAATEAPAETTSESETAPETESAEAEKTE